MLKSIFIVTLLVLSTGHTERVYEEELDYRVMEKGAVSLELAEAWQAPQVAGRRYTLLQPASGAEVYLRLIETDNVGNYAPMRTLGWNAVEIHVEDPDAIVEEVDPEQFELVGAPAFLTGSDNVRAAQMLGPDRELLYFTQVIDPARANFNIGTAETRVDRVFIMVLGTADIEATGSWYADWFGQQVSGPWPYQVKVLSRAWGAPEDTIYELAIAQLQEPFLIEIDEYPAAARPRTRTSAGLPYGPAMVTFRVDSLASVARRLGREPVSPPEPIYADLQSISLEGPSGELIELVAPVE
jgi:catechol 2,3-dioxygenase-like lactoylglutathione lyase family enzyme